MGLFSFKLEHEDRTPADPPTLHTAVLNWRTDDRIPLRADRMLRVIETRFADDELVLVLERPSPGVSVVGDEFATMASRSGFEWRRSLA
jgi:hypothetical protein